MPFYQEGTIKYYKFANLGIPGLCHAVFTRHGGFSPSPWNSLNFGASVGDNLERVRQNREKALSVFNISSTSVYDVYQVHSDKVVVTERPLAINEAHIKADAIITNQPKVTLLMRFADCVPILLFDPVKKAIGIAHAGWKGTVNKIAAKAIVQMKQNYRSNPDNIIAAIGPSIGPDHYPVGSEIIEIVEKNLSSIHPQVVIHKDGKTYFDLWKANQLILNEIGVSHVEIAGICTFCNLSDWYSHRGEFGKTGRFGVILSLI